MTFKCDFTAFSILSNSLKLRLRENISNGKPELTEWINNRVV